MLGIHIDWTRLLMSPVPWWIFTAALVWVAATIINRRYPDA